MQGCLAVRRCLAACSAEMALSCASPSLVESDAAPMAIARAADDGLPESMRPPTGAPTSSSAIDDNSFFG